MSTRKTTTRRPAITRHAIAICEKADELLALLHAFDRKHRAARYDPCNVEARIMLSAAAGVTWPIEQLLVSFETFIGSGAACAE